MLVLGIESSCDETGLALYDTERGLLSHALHSQIAMHRDYGGVVPELASRDHIRRALPLMEEVLETSGAQRGDIDAIAFTQGPGLAGALLVGASIANALALSLGHADHRHPSSRRAPAVAAARRRAAAISVRGAARVGRTHAADARHRVGGYELLGETLDDAAGEAFDKTAKLLGLGYPGGPEVVAARGIRHARRGRAAAADARIPAISTSASAA